MPEIELAPSELQLLGRIVSEGTLKRDSLDPTDGCRLLRLLRAALVGLDYGGTHTTIEPTDRGRQIVSDLDLNSTFTVEALL